MTTSPGGPVRSPGGPARRRELRPGPPLARAVEECARAVRQGDGAAIDTAYEAACWVAEETGAKDVLVDLAHDHVAQLLDARWLDKASERCAAYLHTWGGAPAAFLVLRAEICLAAGRHEEAARVTAELRGLLPDAAIPGGPEELGPEELGRLLRVDGLAASERGALDEAAELLAAAESQFRAAGASEAVAEITRDRLAIAARSGDDQAITQVLAHARPRSVADQVLLVHCLKRHGRYQEAVALLLTLVEHDLATATSEPAGPGPQLATDPGVVTELANLFRLLRRDDLLPALDAAREALSAPDEARVTPTPIGPEPADPCGDSTPPRFDRGIRAALDLVARGRLDEAETAIVELRARAGTTTRDTAWWHLAAAALETALGTDRTSPPWTGGAARVRVAASVDQAKGHLRAAIRHATADSLVEVRIDALRGLGQLHFACGDRSRALGCWAEAHDLETAVAMRQPSDLVAVRMLLPVPDEHDEHVRFTADLVSRDGRAALPAVVVAMEAARATAMLAKVLPDHAGGVPGLPAPGDLDGARSWVEQFCLRLPRRQAAWIMHVTPHEIHHVILGRRRQPLRSGPVLTHHRIGADRAMLLRTLAELRQCQVDVPHLMESAGNGSFDAILDRLADQLGIAAVVSALPRKVRRIAVTAGGLLADAPFPALRPSSQAQRLGLSFALSDLPCLSAAAPLRRRSDRTPRGRSLLVRGPGKLTAARPQRGRKVLEPDRATPEGLREELDRRPYERVRVDAHGRHDDDHPTRSYLQLVPEEPDGRLTAAQLASTNLRSCAVLILGTCESGSTTVLGRDQRMGLVRAAFQAGASAVVAATWPAHDETASYLLDRFEHHLRHLPRDVALRRARRDTCRHGSDHGASSHPAGWACWTLFGDCGPRPRAGVVLRTLHRIRTGLTRPSPPVPYP